MDKTSLRKSSISLGRIQKSFNAFSKNLTKTKTTAIKLNRTILKSNVFRQKAMREQQRLFNLRRNNVRRKLREDVVEAGRGLKSVIKRTGKIVSESTKGFFGRILDYFGLILLGWLLKNLPQIMEMTQKLIERVKKLFTILNEWKNGLLEKLNGMKELVGAVISNISKFDFTDQSGQIKQAMEKINQGSKKMETNFDKMVQIFQNPLGFLFGDDPTEVPNAGPDDTSGYGSPEQQALLKTIRFAEGTAGPTGYSMFFGDRYGESKYGDLTNLTVEEVEKLVTKFLQDPQSKFTYRDKNGNLVEDRSAAVGAYQFINITALAESVKMSTNRKFDKAFQDELALRLAAARGVDVEKLKKEGLSEDVIKRLSPTWASFPGNDYGQPTKAKDKLKERYKASLESARKNATITQKRSITIDEANVKMDKHPSVGFSGKGGEFGASREGGRLHQGIDIGTRGEKGWYVGARIDGTVTFTGTSGGYGKLVIIKDSGGTEYWFAHLANIRVRKGQTYKFGTTIGEIGNTGTSTNIHLHFEVRPGGTPVNPQPYLNLLSIGRELKEVDDSGNVVSKSADISSIPTEQRTDVASKITTERKGPVIAMQVPSSGESSKEPMASSASSGGSGQTINKERDILKDLLYIKLA